MSEYLRQVRPYVVRFVPVAAAICFLCWCYVSVRPFHAWDDAEPEILNQAWRLSQGEQIYRTIDTPPYLHTAYPPLYFTIVAAALKLTGLSYLPAKLVSFLSVLAIGVALALLAAVTGAFVGSKLAARTSRRHASPARGVVRKARGVGEAAELAGLGLKLLQNPIVRGYIASAVEGQLKKRFSM